MWRLTEGKERLQLVGEINRRVKGTTESQNPLEPSGLGGCTKTALFKGKYGQTRVIDTWRKYGR